MAFVPNFMKMGFEVKGRGIFKVLGGRWQVLGGRWQVLGGRWQVAGGREMINSS
jgi:hypothetical protein